MCPHRSIKTYGHAYVRESLIVQGSQEHEHCEHSYLLRDMMGEKRQDVLMGSILLYTIMKIPTIT